MRHFSQNAKWLQWFAPFRGLVVSTGYLTPFFLQHGISYVSIFALQSAFSVAYLLWEIPSGMLADRIGRAKSIKLSVPLVAVSTIAYGFSSHFWQFLICELVMALGAGLISGIDTALIIDSLKSEGLQGNELDERFTRISRRIKAFGFLAALPGAVLAWLLIKPANLGLGSTLVADGLLTVIGGIFAWKLIEAKHTNGKPKLGWREHLRELVGELAKLASNRHARWLLVLGAALNTATYVGYWLAAPYYKSLGIGAVWFGAAFAIRSVWTGGCSLIARRQHKPRRQPHPGRSLTSYAVTVGLVYLGMATGSLWLVWVVLGHDTVRALQEQPITARLNHFMPDEHRATLNSAVNLTQRLAFAAAGPIAGLLVSTAGLSLTFVILGLSCSSLALLAVWRLHVLGAFR